MKALPLSSQPSFRSILPALTLCETRLVACLLGRVVRRYFLIPRKDFYRRPDLQFTGRTIMGKLAPRGQEMCDTNVQYRGNPPMGAPMSHRGAGAPVALAWYVFVLQPRFRELEFCF